METRKIQQVGGGTYTVSIPVHWANEHDVGAGDTAYLYTHTDGSLVVRWNEREHSALSSTTLDVDGASPAAARRALDAAYAVGYHRIELRADGGPNDDVRKAVVDRARTLSGVGVSEEDGDGVVVQGLLDDAEVSVRQSVLQLRFTALSMHENALAALGAPAVDVEHVLDRTTESDRLARLLARQANRALVDRAVLDDVGLSRRQLAEYAVAARQLSLVAGEAAGIARRVQDHEHPPSEDATAALHDLGEAARNVVEDATDALVDGGDCEAAQAALDRADSVLADARSVERALVQESPSGAVHLVRVLDHLLRTAECGERVAAAALRASLQD
jgi:phosphate uptake regulator